MSNPVYIVTVVLVALGFLAIVMEFFVPGMFLGAIGGFMLLAAVVAGFIVDPVTGLWTFVVSGVAAAVAVLLGTRIVSETPLTLRHTQGTDEGFVAGPEGLAKLSGKRGMAVTVLRPSGLVEIEGQKVDVVTEGEMIDQGTSIEVLRVDGTRVVVRAERPAKVEPPKG